jgi:hypothetical protein
MSEIDVISHIFIDFRLIPERRVFMGICGMKYPQKRLDSGRLLRGLVELLFKGVEQV